MLIFHTDSETVIEIGRTFRSRAPEDIIPKLNRHSIRDVLVQEAQQKSETNLNQKRCALLCCLSMDAGSLSARHFIVDYKKYEK